VPGEKSVSSTSKQETSPEVDQAAPPSPSVQPSASSHVAAAPTKNSKLLLLLGMLLALAGLSQVDVSDHLEIFDLEVEPKYPIDEMRSNFGPEERLEDFMGNNGGEAAAITVITTEGNWVDDYAYLHRLAFLSHLDFLDTHILHPTKILRLLIGIQDADGRQIIVLPNQPNIRAKPLRQIYSRIFKSAITWLVVEKGFTVIAPAPSEPGVYTESLSMILTCAPAKSNSMAPISADVHFPYDISPACMTFYTAAAVARIKTALLDSGRSSMPSKTELIKLFSRTSVISELENYSLPRFSPAHMDQNE